MRLKPGQKFQVFHEEGRVGTIEVSSWSGQHLEPFDRLVLLTLMGLWYDQGCDPQGRIAFSYRELFRRLDMKVGGRQNEAVKSALARLRPDSSARSTVRFQVAERLLSARTDCAAARHEGRMYGLVRQFPK